MSDQHRIICNISVDVTGYVMQLQRLNDRGDVADR